MAEQIGAVLAGTKSLFWQIMGDGILQASADLGVEVLIRAPNDDDPTALPTAQLKMIDYMLDAGAKGIILAAIPLPEGHAPVDIPVPIILVDRSSKDFAGLATISTDNFAAGKLAAMSLKNRLTKGARLGVFRINPAVPSTTQREDGFAAAAKQLGFEIIFETYVGDGVRNIEGVVTAALTQAVGPVDAVFAPHDFSTFAVLRVLPQIPPDRRPLLVGFDYRPSFEDSLRRGELHAMLVQRPFEMGYQAVKQIMAYRAGQAIPKTVAIDPLLVTADNLDDPAIRKELDRYRP